MSDWEFITDDEFDELQRELADEALHKALDFDAASGDMAFYADDNRIRAVVSVVQLSRTGWAAHVIDHYSGESVKSIWATKKVDEDD